MLTRSLAAVACLLSAAPLSAQAIIAQTSGLANPDHVVDFGANLLPNFTPVSTQFAGLTITHASYFTTGVSNNLVGGFLTNDFSAGPPDTLRIVFASPIRDLTFVYHQIGGSQASVFRAMLGTATVALFTDLSNQFQPNNFFGFTGVVFDTLEIDFVSDFNVDALAFNDAHAHCTFRNGSGVNAADYTCATMPVMATTWQGTIATNAGTISAYLVFALGGAHPGFPVLGGEVLVQLAPAPVVAAGGGTFFVPIPSGPSWLGFTVATQGARLDVVGGQPSFVLLNAQDLVIGI